jgi:hypothetical protein
VARDGKETDECDVLIHLKFSSLIEAEATLQLLK